MSQIGDAVRTTIAKAIQSKWTIKETADFFNEFIGCFDFGMYTDDLTEEDIVRYGEYMLTYDGCYSGLTVNEIRKWLDNQ